VDPNLPLSVSLLAFESVVDSVNENCFICCSFVEWPDGLEGFSKYFSLEVFYSS